MIFNYRWNLKDPIPVKYHGKKVFGTFICGGGSSMGYKLAGYNHLGGLEIDNKLAEIYKLNLDPKYLFIEDIREFNKRNDLPKELFDLDLLDGSPPCSSFSMSGNREKDWGKNKMFAEGQTEQILDDLVFVYCDTILKLKPKVFILENVKGLISGNAKIYLKNIVNKLSDKYNVQIFLLNAASMGVPQRRERVFIIGHLKKYALPKLKLEFNYKPIKFKEIEHTLSNEPPLTEDQLHWWNKCKPGKSFSSVHPKKNWFNAFKLSANSIIPTLTASVGNAEPFHYKYPRKINDVEYKLAGSFPEDYNNLNFKYKFLIGMSVPPVMMANISYQIYLQWLKKIK